MLVLLFRGTGVAAQDMPYFPCSPTLDQPYGLNSEITRQSGEFGRRDEAVELMKGIGVNTLRLPMNWDNFCAPNGSFVYTIYDPAMETLRYSPFTALGVITHNFDARRDAWKTPGDFSSYVRELIKRYRFYIMDWEVIPGMDDMWTSGKKLTAPQYFSTLRGVYSVAKTVNPKNRVILGAPAAVSSKFVDSLLVYGAHNYFDVFSFSSYGYPQDVLQEALSIRRKMYRQGWSKPVWLTNFYYGSYMDGDIPSGFWKEIVPEALKKLGIKPKSVEVAVVVSSSEKGKDALNRYEVEKYLRGLYKSIRFITSSDVKNLSPAEVPLLIPGREVSLEDIEGYVRGGGTIVIDSPRWPSVTHCGILRSGSSEAAEHKAPSIPDYVRAAKGISSSFSWKFTPEATARYLTDANLSGDDEMVPLLVAGNREFEGCVAALYKVRSGGSKGNAIILSRKKIPEYIDMEAEQAKRMGRTYILAFACGVDKVFWNGMRSRETDPTRKRDWSGLYHSDMRPKPSASAYRTLTTLLPPGSTRPTFRTDSGVYLSNWTNAEGSKVWAVWTESRKSRSVNITISGKYQLFDYLGNKLKDISEISDGIVYICGADSVEFNTK